MSTVYNSIIDRKKLEKISKYYSLLPDLGSETNDQIINKKLEYHNKNDISYNIFSPLFTEILGEHDLDVGAYKESSNPYPIHTDSASHHEYWNDRITRRGGEEKHNMALLVPLVEGPEFKTVVFDAYSEEFFKEPDPKILIDDNGLDPDEFRHCQQCVTRLPLEISYEWKLGDILTWDRNQLHASADFARHGLIKKFLIFFML